MTKPKLPVIPTTWCAEKDAMPKLTAEQIEAVKRIVDHRLARFSRDLPRVDDQHFNIQMDLDQLLLIPQGGGK